jgi:phosphopantothenoylcysteine decarboxylase/phosphopantothenate--cysteine ligase
MLNYSTQFISPLTFQALSAHPVYTQLLDAGQENAMGHINLARWADILFKVRIMARVKLFFYA